MCGADWVEPAIFFWRDGCNQGLIKPNCNPMSMSCGCYEYFFGTPSRCTAALVGCVLRLLIAILLISVPR